MRVIDITETKAGLFATLLLANLGLDVIKIERPQNGIGDRLQYSASESMSDMFLNRGKRRVTLDLTSEQGTALLFDLVGHADAIVEDAGPGRTDTRRLLRVLRRNHPDLVITSISPFGHKGPRSTWQANEFISQAMGGVVWGTGWDDETPLRLPGYQANYLAGLNAANATLAAVYGVHAGICGGSHIDVSIQETFSLHWTRQVTRYAYSGRPYRRERHGSGRQGFPHTVKAKDGYVYMLAMHAEWEEFALFLGLEQFVTHEWSDPEVRATRWDEIAPSFFRAVGSRSKYDWFTSAAEHGYTFAPVDEPLDLLNSPQLSSRMFFKAMRLATGEYVRCPSLPFSLDEVSTDSYSVQRPGSSNDEVFRDLLMVGDHEMSELRSGGVI